jgi:hypothetical protein
MTTLFDNIQPDKPKPTGIDLVYDEVQKAHDKLVKMSSECVRAEYKNARCV